MHVVLASMNPVLRICGGVRFVCFVVKRKFFRLLINRGKGLSHRNQRRRCPSKKEEIASCPVNCVTSDLAIAQNAEDRILNSNCKAYVLLFMKTSVYLSTSRTSTGSSDYPSSSQLVRLCLVARKFRTAACSCCASSQPV